MAFYSDRKESLEKYYIDKIIYLKDKKSLDWSEENIESFLNNIGNFIVLDIPKKNTVLDKKLEYYQTSKIINIDKLDTLKYNEYQKRDKLLKEKLVSFFKGGK